MFQLRGPRSDTDIAAVEFVRAESELSVIRDSAPMADLHSADVEWNEALGRFQRIQMPTAWFEHGEDLRNYLATVEALCRAALYERHGEAVPSQLESYFNIVAHYNRAEVFLESMLAYPQLEIQQVGVLDIRGMSGPPYLRQQREGRILLVPGNGYRIDAIVDLGETMRSPFGATRLKSYRKYPLRLSMAWDLMVLRTGCLVVDDFASARYQTGDSSGDGAFPPILDPDEWTFDRVVANGHNADGGLRMPAALGSPSDLLREFLYNDVDQDLRTVTLGVRVSIPGMSLSEEILARYLEAVREFDDWVRSPG